LFAISEQCSRNATSPPAKAGGLVGEELLNLLCSQRNREFWRLACLI
jgi:hypothetical protein